MKTKNNKSINRRTFITSISKTLFYTSLSTSLFAIACQKENQTEEIVDNPCNLFQDCNDIFNCKDNNFKCDSYDDFECDDDFNCLISFDCTQLNGFTCWDDFSCGNPQPGTFTCESYEEFDCDDFICVVPYNCNAPNGNHECSYWGSYSHKGGGGG